jgi:2-polyprenyl-6-methoxyphenol hydroxylase-like FAD-dependent oxidoreductase
VHLFEQFVRAQPVGSGLMLQPTGQAVLADLGLLDAMAELGVRISRLIGTDSQTGRAVLDVGYGPLGMGVHALGVHRAALFKVLHDAVVAAKLPLRTAYPISRMERDRGKAWLIGPRGLEGPFDLVVDTMGASSPLRGQAERPGKATALPFGAIWGTVPWIESGFNGSALTQRYHKAKVMVGVMPVGRQNRTGVAQAAFFWSLRPDSYAAVKADGFEKWRSEVQRYWPAVAPHLEALGDFDSLTLARYTHFTLPVPKGEAIAFVGDSAHSTSPQLGQGANMALLDAAALAHAIDAAVDLADALSLYAQMRREHVRLYQGLSLLLTPFYQSESKVLPVMRDVFMRALSQLPPISRLLATMVAGQLLNPLKAVGLDPRSPREVVR